MHVIDLYCTNDNFNNNIMFAIILPNIFISNIYKNSSSLFVFVVSSLEKQHQLTAGGNYTVPSHHLRVHHGPNVYETIPNNISLLYGYRIFDIQQRYLSCKIVRTSLVVYTVGRD